jgi:streptogramin lyase
MVVLSVAGCGGGGGGSSGGTGGTAGSPAQKGGSGPPAGTGGSLAGSGGVSGGTGGSTPGTGGAAPGTGGSTGSGGVSGGAGGSGPPPDGGADTPPAAGMLKIDKIFEIPGASAGAPHDPAVDSKGVAWWTDQNGSRIGFWDPATDMSMVWPTPTQPCNTHGLVPDSKDNIWYTGQGCNKLGYLDRATNMITEYPAGGSAPHTPVIVDGIVWYTLQGSAQIGRLDPQAPAGMQVRTFNVGPGPYGIWVAPNKHLWVALHATNQIVDVDPANPEAMTRITLPNAGSRPRRIAVDRKGHVYYTDDGRQTGFLGRYDPTNPALPMAQRFSEWPTPGGAGPYAITVGPAGDDRLFYGFTRRATIAVFDPKNPMTPQAEVQIPVQVAANRHMATDETRRRIWLGLSGARRVAYIQLP